MPITDPQHPYYAYDDSAPHDIDSLSPEQKSDLASLGDDGSPPPMLHRTSYEELKDIERRSENLSPADRATIEHFQETQKMISSNPRKSFMIRAPWKD